MPVRWLLCDKYFTETVQSLLVFFVLLLFIDALNIGRVYLGKMGKLGVNG